MREDFDPFEGVPHRWPKETVALALRSLAKVWYPYDQDEYLDNPLLSTILSEEALPLLLIDPDEIDDYSIVEKLQLFVGLIEGVETIEDLHQFMREQSKMLLKAREDDARRRGMDVEEAAQQRAEITKLLGQAKRKFNLDSGETEGQL